MKRIRVLFKGSHSVTRTPKDTDEQLETAKPIARALGESLIMNNCDVMLNGESNLAIEVGLGARDACKKLDVVERERIRTYPRDSFDEVKIGFGMVLAPGAERSLDVRTFLVQEADAVVGLIGGKGTSDCIQKAILAKKLVFPIPLAGGAAGYEWERLRHSHHFNMAKGDLDFLGDKKLDPASLSDMIVEQCKLKFKPNEARYSRRIFIVHGHDSDLKNELARLLDRLDFTPVILHEQPDHGKTLFDKLQSVLSDVGFAFILLTPDDVCDTARNKADFKFRARQNVIFEHGLLIGAMGPERVLAIAKGDIEAPSDLQGFLFKNIPLGGDLNSITLDLIKELKNAGYEIDTNKLV